MTVITYDIPVTKTKVEIESTEKCKCGGGFNFNLLHSGKKKKKYQGIIAKCNSCNEEYYDMYEKDLLNKIKRLQHNNP